jgi:hypothetical protein
MKVSELKGPQLDYWAARAEGRKARITPWGVEYLAPTEKTHAGVGCWHRFSPSTNGDQGIAIIERECIDLTHIKGMVQPWLAMSEADEWGHRRGDTPLEAATRCFVAGKFGDEVPDEIEE